ncbi:hypothetical protein [Nonomuraea longicatena]|uniref:Uncharacterized protein n=1 Tax=Nonomuraea longicatena TaxID=83682 RepID=A0ABN1P9J3_9ACTN
MMYGPPQQRPPRQPTSPPIVVLAAGLAGVAGFLFGLVSGLSFEEPASRPGPTVTVTAEPEMTADPPAPPAPQNPVPQETLPQNPAPQPPAPQNPVPSAPPATPTGPPATGGPPGTGVTGGPTGGPAATPGGPGADPTGVRPTGGGFDGGFDGLGAMRKLAVPSQMAPGTYRTAGPTAGQDTCYWARMRGESTADLIAGDMPQGPATITIQPTDKLFVTAGCAEWIKA